MKTKVNKDIFIIGFALFSMFFGAGNVIFPPYLGMGAGPHWLAGFLCYYAADIGLALLTMFSMFRKGGYEPLVRPIGKVASTLLMCTIVLCIGPMLAIPRTAATTYEMSVMPLLPGVGNWAFSISFFLLIFLLTLRESSVVDIVGQFLTPMLLIGLLILITVGIFHPLGDIAALAQAENIAATGIKAGYQTMDVLATLIFGILILHSATKKGYTEPALRSKVAGQAGLIAGGILFVIYGGLTYLGATVSGIYDLSISRSALVLAIVRGLLGNAGTVLFSIVVALACITTAVGLVSSCADYFSMLCKDRLSYRFLVTLICVFSAVACNVGLDELISLAAPVLDIIYPPTLVLIVLSCLKPLPVPVYRMGALGAFLFSVLSVASSYTQLALPLLNDLPFAALGFGWVLPTAIFAGLGFLIPDKHSRRAR